MKTLASIIIILFLSGSAVATNRNDTDHYVDFYPSFNQPFNLPVRTGNQPDIGSETQSNFFPGKTDSFWKQNEELLNRDTNPLN